MMLVRRRREECWSIIIMLTGQYQGLHYLIPSYLLILVHVWTVITRHFFYCSIRFTNFSMLHLLILHIKNHFPASACFLLFIIPTWTHCTVIHLDRHFLLLFLLLYLPHVVLVMTLLQIIYCLIIVFRVRIIVVILS